VKNEFIRIRKHELFNTTSYENYAGEIKNDESLVQYKEKDGDIFEDYCGGKLARLTLKEIEEIK
jgi:hypothetical protein